MRARPPARAPGAAPVLIAAVVLAACATAPPTPAPPSQVAREQVAELARQWATEWDGFSGLRAAVDMTLKKRGASRRTAAVLLLGRNALRVEVATPFGLPALVGTMAPEGITVFHVLERQAHVGRATPETVGEWLGVPIAPESLIRLLIGNVTPPPDPAEVSLETAPSPHLAWNENGTRHHVWVSTDGWPTRLLLERASGDRVSAEFERVAGAGGITGLRLAAPRREAELTVRYLATERVALPLEAFQLALPADVPVVPFD